MNAEMRAALEASIEKWERNVAAEMPSAIKIKWDACPLCVLVFSAKGQGNCTGCPVVERTVQDDCKGSPYYDASRALGAWNSDPNSRSEWQRAAQAEVDFLKSLRPVEP